MNDQTKMTDEEAMQIANEGAVVGKTLAQMLGVICHAKGLDQATGIAAMAAMVGSVCWAFTETGKRYNLEITAEDCIKEVHNLALAFLKDMKEDKPEEK